MIDCKAMRTWVKIFDIVIILLVASVTFFAAYMAYIKPQGSSQVLIRGQGGEWTYPLNAEERVTVQGPLGNTVVRLFENRAWIESSPCENKTCIAAGSVSSQGQWTACLPNNVLLIIQGIRDHDVDSVAW
ncbi:MAG: NusG domain II-containing protein [Treponema sp.]|nr:NusG domain II-containing protein [Treponema sp.]